MISHIGDFGYNILVGSSAVTRQLGETDQLEKMVFKQLLAPMMKSFQKNLGSSISGAQSTLNSSMMIQQVVDNMATGLALNHDLGLIQK